MNTQVLKHHEEMGIIMAFKGASWSLQILYNFILEMWGVLGTVLWRATSCSSQPSGV